MSLTTFAAQITAAGVTAPTYAEILAELQDRVRAIYGADIYIAPDSQDGQLLAIFAKAIDDANQMTRAVYNAFSPTTAQGAGLSSVVKINNIRRLVPTQSTAPGNVVGTPGTVINNGSVRDENGNIWNLPALVTIPSGATIAVTVTAVEAGAITAPSGTINVINTPTLGWNTFVSTSDATVGAPAESDAELRRRQSASAGLFAKTPIATITAAIQALVGVLRVRVYENPTGVEDADGLPPHSISAVVDGGDLQQIADAIGETKTPGCATFGDTTEVFEDPYSGIPYDIDFFELELTTVTVQITIQPLFGFTTAIETTIKEKVAEYLNGLPIGEDVALSRVYGPAYLNGAPGSSTYEITVLHLDGGTADVAIDFNKAATNNGGSNIVITVL